MAHAGALADSRLLVLDGTNVKWGAPAFGAGATVTFALATSASEFSDARNCRSLVPAGAILTANHIAPAIMHSEVAAAFAAWSAVADVTFREVGPSSADILIGAQGDPFGVAFTNVWHGAETPKGPAPITRSVICLNPDAGWKVGFDGNLKTYDLRYTIEHEIGHALGLDHPGVPGVLMDFRYTEMFRVPQAGDIAAIDLLYGPRGGAVVAASTTAPTTSVAAVAMRPDPFLGHPAP
jgi:hypothetical protein